MSREPGVLERILDLPATEGDESQRAAAFTRGLVIGALVGAAIAGSAIWQRRQSRDAEPPLPGPQLAEVDDPRR